MGIISKFLTAVFRLIVIFVHVPILIVFLRGMVVALVIYPFHAPYCENDAGASGAELPRGAWEL